MPDPQWENLKEMFHAALALPPDQRAAYLDDASSGDASLRQALESLLKSHEETNNFIDAPAYQAAAEMLAGDREVKPDQQVAHYRIVSMIGEGGMGRVYLAEDTKLHRRVALKFLSGTLTQDHDRLLRFEQEARAASALNHPNILTIYEISEVESHRFIAAELIEGETLRERMQRGIALGDALDMAIQIASALVAAHRVSIVHRDIKPENIMIRRDDGLVKVLDFGLAKMSESAAADVVRKVDDDEHARLKTGPGVVLGTVAYMSPEQARGGAVDARTDVWSLGVILYEMIVGHSPFIASSSNEIISAILDKSPAPPLSRFTRDVPERLEEIVAKALTKRKEDRYQTSQDLLIDLRRLRQSLTVVASVEESKPNEDAPSRTRRSVPAIAAATRAANAEYLFSPIRANKRSVVTIALIAVLIMVSGVAIYAWRFKHIAAASAAAPQIKSLAVLPLKSLDSDQNYLGVGIADAVITKISQTGQLTVRPTSAVLKYVKEDTDSLTAARQLSADAVLEGTVQRVGDRLRVTVNLLRTNDGTSLYTDSFDLATVDVFAIQDKVAQQVESRLRVTVHTSEQARLYDKYPTDPRAYEAYIRGVTSLDERGYDKTAMPQMSETINFFKKAIEIDPKYALPHAQLGMAYAWTEAFIRPDEPKWADLARAEIKQANDLNPNLAETHVAHALLLWQASEGYQTAEAIRELRLAKQLNHNVSSPDLPALYGHIGLDELAVREAKGALEINPTNPPLKAMPFVLAYLRADPDGYIPDDRINDAISGDDINLGWYYMRKGRLDEAQKLIDERLRKNPPTPEYLLVLQAQLRALKGDFATAEASIVSLMQKIPISEDRHHYTYDAACIYALAGNSSEAVKWLKETAATGFPNYPLFARDHFLDRIRNSPEFVHFIAEQKEQWERYRQEFDN